LFEKFCIQVHTLSPLILFDVISKIRAVATFIIFRLQTFRTRCRDVLVSYMHAKFHILAPACSMVIIIIIIIIRAEAGEQTVLLLRET